MASNPEGAAPDVAPALASSPEPTPDLSEAMASVEADAKAGRGFTSLRTHVAVGLIAAFRAARSSSSTPLRCSPAAHVTVHGANQCECGAVASRRPIRPAVPPQNSPAIPAEDGGSGPARSSGNEARDCDATPKPEPHRCLSVECARSHENINRWLE